MEKKIDSIRIIRVGFQLNINTHNCYYICMCVCVCLRILCAYEIFPACQLFPVAGLPYLDHQERRVEQREKERKKNIKLKKLKKKNGGNRKADEEFSVRRTAAPANSFGKHQREPTAKPSLGFQNFFSAWKWMQLVFMYTYYIYIIFIYMYIKTFSCFY